MIKKTIFVFSFLGIRAESTKIDFRNLLSFLTESDQNKAIPILEQAVKNFENEKNKMIKMGEQQINKLTYENGQVTLERDRAVAESNIYRDKLSVTHQQLKQFEGTWGKVKGPCKITEPPLPKNLYYIYNNAYDDLSHFCYYIFDFFFAGSAYYSSPYKS